MAIALVWVAATPGSADARWLKAETRRFVVYSDGEEAELREFATKLTRFDEVLRLLHGIKDRELERKLDVYLVRGSIQLARVAPGAGAGTLGFYRAEPDGIFAVAIRRYNYGFGADDVLFHEYTHHFMLEYFPAAYPGWLIEGYAEYYATVEVTPQNIDVGRYNPLRAGSLMRGEWMPLKDLLTVPAWKVHWSDRDHYYAQSWLLTHYMRTDATRSRQLDEAIHAMAQGTPPVQAMETATGMPLADLNTALHRYVHSKLLYRRMTNPLPPDTPMTVTTLPPSADALLLESLSLGEVDRAFRGDVLRTVRARAKDFPGDALADLTLARAEITYGDRKAGEAILERRLKADPKELASLRLMGESLLKAGAADEAHKAEQFAAARPYLARAYAVDSSDYQTLYDYVRARSTDADYPNENTLNALLLAQQLAPSVDAIRLTAGEALLKRGQKDEAVGVLTPLANSPHSGNLQAQAAKLIAQARGEPPPDPDADAKAR